MYKQYAFSKSELRYVKSWSHGGVSLKKRRKIKRPLLPKKKIHVVFKSQKATGTLSLLKHSHLVNSLVKERAKKYLITIHQFENMGNHLHLLISCNSIENIQNFLKTFAALLARKITGARKGIKFGQFWDSLVFTRVLHSSLEILSIKGYFHGNRLERDYGGMAREEYLARFNSFIKKLKKTKAENQKEAEILLSLE